MRPMVFATPSLSFRIYLALIDRDLTHVPPETLREARVMLTVVGGQVAFGR